MKYKCRNAQLEDNEAIAEIFNYEIENSTSVFDLRARTHAEQLIWFEEHSGVYSIIVIDDPGGDNDGNSIIGFASLSQYRTRPGYNTTSESSVYIHREHRGKGAGYKLLEGIIEQARQNGFHTLIARIAEPNEASVALHKACGFELIGIEKEVARKFGRWLDCGIFQKIL